MHVYVIDESLDYWWRRTAEVQPEPKAVISVNHTWEIERICRRVAGVARAGLGVLALAGHGRTLLDPGDLQIGEGLSLERAWHFAQLRGLWTGRHPRIEIHACYAASEMVTAPRCRPNPDRAWQSFTAAVESIGSRQRREITHADICVPGQLGPAAPGGRLLREIANRAGAMVLAGCDAQFADWGFRLEGPVRWYQPVERFPLAAAA